MHDPDLPHNRTVKRNEKKKDKKKRKKDDDDDEDRDAIERINFLTLLQFIAFGVNRGGAALYPRLLDFDETASNNALGINAAIAYMQYHFKGVGVVALRMDIALK